MVWEFRWEVWLLSCLWRLCLLVCLFVCLLPRPFLSLVSSFLLHSTKSFFIIYFRKFSFMIDDGSLYCPIMKQFIIVHEIMCVRKCVWKICFLEVERKRRGSWPAEQFEILQVHDVDEEEGCQMPLLLLLMVEIHWWASCCLWRFEMWGKFNFNCNLLTKDASEKAQACEPRAKTTRLCKTL